MNSTWATLLVAAWAVIWCAIAGYWRARARELERAQAMLMSQAHRWRLESVMTAWDDYQRKRDAWLAAEDNIGTARETMQEAERAAWDQIYKLGFEVFDAYRAEQPRGRSA